MKKTVIGLALATCCSAASATTYNINAVLNGSDGEFGFSGFHFAGDTVDGTDANDIDNDGNAMTGSSLATFLGIDGTGFWNSLTGEFNLVLNLDGGGTVTLSNPGTGDGVLVSDPFILDVDFSNNDTVSLYDTTIVFDNSIVCCGGASSAPNSFDSTEMTMSLWGADYVSGGIVISEVIPPELGLDLRIELTQVPVPAAAWLFGTGLLGLLGVARRKSS